MKRFNLQDSNKLIYEATELLLKNIEAIEREDLVFNLDEVEKARKIISEEEAKQKRYAIIKNLTILPISLFVFNLFQFFLTRVFLLLDPTFIITTNLYVYYSVYLILSNGIIYFAYVKYNREL